MTPQKFGDLEVRLARNAGEVEAAQRLRYSIFYEEMGAWPDAATAALKRDFDDIDGYADHLLVIDTKRPENNGIVGTYRVLRRCHARAHGGFYSAGEFDLAAVLDWPGEVMELGRSCVHADYRRGAILQLLWRGIAAYAREYKAGLLFGCASFPGSDPAAVALGLSYLHHSHMAPWSLRPRARDSRYVAMDAMAPHLIDDDVAVKSLPPLIKGYLRVGACVGDGAVIDYQFNTVDVCVVVRLDQVTERYSRHFRPTNSQRPVRAPSTDLPPPIGLAGDFPPSSS